MNESSFFKFTVITDYQKTFKFIFFKDYFLLLCENINIQCTEIYFKYRKENQNKCDAQCYRIYKLEQLAGAGLCLCYFYDK